MNKTKKTSIKNQYKVFAVLSVTVLSIYAVSLLLPLIWAVLASLKGRFDFRQNVFGIPQEWVWSNYIDSFTKLSLKIIIF